MAVRPSLNIHAVPIHAVPSPAGPPPVILLAGQPNTGKTSLFNHLTGLKAHTANYPGTTVQLRSGALPLPSGTVAELYDLPGLYSLEGGGIDQEVAGRAILGSSDLKPSLLVIVLDVTRLQHQLALVGELLAQGLPTIVILNMMDEARRIGVEIEPADLSRELGVQVLPLSVKLKEGVVELLQAIERTLVVTAQGGSLEEPSSGKVPPALQAAYTGCGGCRASARCAWADTVVTKIRRSASRSSPRSDALDRIVTRPLSGIPIFFLIMAALFWSVFTLAAYPMEWLDGAFGSLSEVVSQSLPSGFWSSFLADGVIAGVGGVLVFLPQICMLFFLLALLDDSGYLARAVVVMDRVMQRVGLPGQAFVPMLSAHACAIPAIMSTRVIESRVDRIRTILILPLLTCSARLPVYLMVGVLLFGGDSFRASLLFLSGYLLGISAAVAIAFLLQRTVLPGKPLPLMIELPPYRIPSLRDAFLIAVDRGQVFLKQAGTVILSISLLLWLLSSYPKLPPDQLSPEAQQGSSVAALEYSAIGRIGRFVEPVFAPLGFDWRISVAVLTSFAAREVLVSSLAVMSGVGEGGDGAPSDREGEMESEETGLISKLRGLTRSDGTLLFTLPTCISLFVFFVLAMQCLPTQAITAKETGSIKWAVFQFCYMSALAYGAAYLAYHLAG